MMPLKRTVFIKLQLCKFDIAFYITVVKCLKLNFHASTNFTLSKLSRILMSCHIQKNYQQNSDKIELLSPKVK